MAPDLERSKHLGKFMKALQISGYDHQYHYHLLQGILNRERERWRRRSTMDQESETDAGRRSRRARSKD